MWCHLLLLAPVATLALFWVLPWPLALAVNVAVTAAAVGIAVPSIRALRRPVSTGREGLIGRVVETVSDVGYEGLVRSGGELWTAKAANGARIPKGQAVRVVDVLGAKLVIEPLGTESASAMAGNAER